MDTYEKYRAKIGEEIDKIEKFKTVTPKNRFNMFTTVIYLLFDLCYPGRYYYDDFKRDDIIQNIPKLFEKKHDIILEIFPPYRIYYHQIHCYIYLHAKSGLRFLIDNLDQGFFFPIYRKKKAAPINQRINSKYILSIKTLQIT